MSILFEGVTKTFSKRVLDDVSFEVPTGRILFILGRSGVGKSVTLKHIVGLLLPDSGRVIVDGLNVPELDASALAEVRRKCGMVFQHPALLDSISVFDNVAFGLRTPLFRLKLGRALARDEETQIVREKLRLVHLDDESIWPKLPTEISYGMQKRVSLARTLAPGPAYLLFDEPTTGLDPISTRAITGLIRDLSRTLQVTSVVVSHDMQSALEIADQILVLDQGQIAFFGNPSEARTSSLPLLKDFLKEIP